MDKAEKEAVDMLQKPHTPSELIEAVAKIIRERDTARSSLLWHEIAAKMPRVYVFHGDDFTTDTRAMTPDQYLKAMETLRRTNDVQTMADLRAEYFRHHPDEFQHVSPTSSMFMTVEGPVDLREADEDAFLKYRQELASAGQHDAYYALKDAYMRFHPDHFFHRSEFEHYAPHWHSEAWAQAERRGATWRRKYERLRDVVAALLK